MRRRGEHTAPAAAAAVPLGWAPPSSGQTAAGHTGRRPFPPAGMPSKAQLDYTEKLIVVSLLVLAVPYLVKTLITRPGDVLAARGRAAVQKV